MAIIRIYKKKHICYGKFLTGRVEDEDQLYNGIGAFNLKKR